MTKWAPPAFLQVMEQERTGELGPGAVLDGGDSDTERRCTYMEAALALAGGLDAAALETLFKAAKPGVQVGMLCVPCVQLGGGMRVFGCGRARSTVQGG